ncbi:MAG: radical SAM protein [Deltaproteobacteria bacterium]|nr:radical SAM protein [Deltaproteobacteria bacterium]MBW2084890.1 radical SAM protein [Deltaproteobacteria bacterium]
MAPTLKELCLEVTNLCPMACMHCSTISVKEGTGPAEHMPISVAKSVVKEFKALGGHILEISGGEPLLYPHLFELLQYAATLDLEVRLYTSGIVSADDRGLIGISSGKANKLKAAGVSRIIFSLQGATSQTHDSIVGASGAHTLVLSDISNIKAAGLWTGVHFVPMAPNYQEIDALMDICWSLRVDELALLRFVPQGRGLKNRSMLEMTLEKFDSFLKLVVQGKKQYPNLNVRVGCPMDFLSLYEEGLKPHPCKAGRCTCLIASSGDVVPCPGFKNSPDFIAGNIYNENLSTIWREGFKSLREFDYHKLSGMCQGCSNLKWCHGRCAAQRVITYGDLYVGPDPSCPKQLKDGTRKEEKAIDKYQVIAESKATPSPIIESDRPLPLIASR